MNVENKGIISSGVDKPQQLQELRNMYKMFRGEDTQRQFRDFIVENLNAYPGEVQCECCGDPYVLGGPCWTAEADDPEQPSMSHVTIQEPTRPWNQYVSK